METLRRDGATLAYDVVGAGEPLVLVHGGWNERARWALLLPHLTDRFRVLAHDRRGHGESTGAGPVSADVDDLLALVDVLGPPVHVVGNSAGGTVALRAAARSPGSFRSILVHEPPLLALAPEDPDVRAFVALVERVLSLLREGRDEEGTRMFLDSILPPGTFDALPAAERAVPIRHAPTFLEEASDPDLFTVDTAALGAVADRLTVCVGSQGRRDLRVPAEALVAAVPGALLAEVAGAGHVPHLTHPAEYAARITQATART